MTRLPADIEVSIHRWDPDGESYAVEMRFSDPSPGRYRERAPAIGVAQFDLGLLRTLALGYRIKEYGALLTKNLFIPPLLEMFKQVRGQTEPDQYLRLRIFITSSAPELNDQWWETLIDPLSLDEQLPGGLPSLAIKAEGGDPAALPDAEWLATSQSILFSRYLSNPYFRPVQLRPKSDSRVLVVIADPEGLGKSGPGNYPKLGPIGGETVFAATVAALDTMRATFLGRTSLGKEGESPPTVTAEGKNATLDNVINELGDASDAGDEYDILYLVCHGGFVKNRPALYLENAQGRVEVVSGADFTSRLNDLGNRPRLVVLASCQSAGSGAQPAPGGQGGALASLGPRLSRLGIPAVVAMQGNVSLETLGKFMPEFLQEVGREGQVDRAVARARDAVRGHADSWMPVLFSRLSSGRVWYNPGFGQEHQEEFSRWLTLLTSIKTGFCTPILGPGLLEPLVGSRHEIARNWASIYNFPLSRNAEEELPQVAQYLSVNQDPFFIRQVLKNTLSHEVIKRFGKNKRSGKKLPEQYQTLPEDIEDERLEELLGEAWKIRTEEDKDEIHTVLAGLPCPIYITTNPDRLLFYALKRATHAGALKEPKQGFYRWNTWEIWPDYASEDESLYVPERDRGYKPTAARPLIYHLFGGLQLQNSVVLTEDNYFEYLHGATRPDNNMPSFVRTAMIDRALLFLGYNLSDWDFRVLIQSLVGREGFIRLGRYTHVAVQLDPEENRMIDPDRARRYLEDRFRGIQLNIFWGSVQDFIGKLREKWNAKYTDKDLQI